MLPRNSLAKRPKIASTGVSETIPRSPITRFPAIYSFLTMLFIFAAAAPALADPPVTDGSKPFHRVYFLGPGNSAEESAALSADLNAMKSALDQSGNALSVNTWSFTNPSLAMVQWAMDSVKNNAQPGDAVTIYLGGHGNVDTVRLRSGEVLTATQFAGMLSGFAANVTVVVLIDSCYGGSFADDIGSSADLAVIGTSTTCPYNPPNNESFVQTFPEAIAAFAGFGAADGILMGNPADGIVTAAELEAKLLDANWKLGEAAPGDVLHDGKNKCDGACDAPAITVTPAECGAPISISGQRFATSDTVTIQALDGAEVESTMAMTDGAGTFAGAMLTGIGELILATDPDGNRDWHVCEGAPVIPDETAPTCTIISGSGVIEATIQDTGSGLADIMIRTAYNVSISPPAFTVGTVDPVVLSGTILNPLRLAYLSLRAEDVAGNRTYCTRIAR